MPYKQSSGNRLYRNEYKANELVNSPKMQYGNYELRVGDKNPSIPYRQLNAGEKARLQSWHHQQASNLSQSLPMTGLMALPVKAAMAMSMTVNGGINAANQFYNYGEIKYTLELGINIGFGAVEGYLGKFGGIGWNAAVVAGANVATTLTVNWQYGYDRDHRGGISYQPPQVQYLVRGVKL
jgi:hypothetical protein